jgi:hypothetical protein
MQIKFVYLNEVLFRLSRHLVNGKPGPGANPSIPPPSRVVQQDLLMAAEEKGEYF